MLLLVLAFYATVQEVVVVSAGGANCSSASDCCYAGSCDAGTCHCDHAFTGRSCCTFQFQPAPSRLISKLPTETGLHDDSSWGGSVIEADGVFHMFKSVLLNSCPINYYNTNSIIVHMTSHAFTGPYVFQDVAMTPRPPAYFDNAYVHAPFITRVPDGSYALYYETASLDHTNYTQPNCTAGNHPTFPNPKSTRCMGIALSHSLDGPWKRLNQSILGDNCVPEANGLRDKHEPGVGDVSNPAVVILPNASALLLYRFEADNHESVGVAFCPHYAGRCQELNLPGDGLFPGWNGEDPYLWLDQNSHVHVVYHCYVNHENPVGCHAVLRDLRGSWTDWVSPSDQAAYYRTVVWDNGTTTTLGRRERPQVLVRKGVPIALFNGATIQAGDSPNASTFTMVQAMA